MTIFAWIIFGASALLLVASVISTLASKASLRGIAYACLVLVLWMIGSIWYILQPALLPYELVIGIVLGSAVLYVLASFSQVLSGAFSILNPFFTLGVAALVFFILVAILNANPSLF